MLCYAIVVYNNVLFNSILTIKVNTEMNSCFA